MAMSGQTGAGERGQRPACGREVGLALTKIAPERNVDPLPRGSRADGEMAGDPLKVDRHFAELVDRGFEFGLAPPRLLGLGRQLGVSPRIRVELSRHLLDPRLSTSNAQLLRRRHFGDLRARVPASSVACTMASNALAAEPLSSSTPATASCPRASARDRVICAVISATSPPRFACSGQALGGELANLLGHDREPAPLPAGARRLDRGVERDEVGEVGDLPDRADEPGDRGGSRSPRAVTCSSSSATNRLSSTSRRIASADHGPVAAGHFGRAAAGRSRPRPFPGHHPRTRRESRGRLEPDATKHLLLRDRAAHRPGRLGQRRRRRPERSVARASAVTCRPICSTVLASGRRSSAMCMAVDTCAARVASADTSLFP